MLSAITYDVLQVAKDPVFFDSSESKREKLAEESLDGYPNKLLAYLAAVSADQLAHEMQQVVEIYGSAQSILSQAYRLVKEENVFFISILDSLKELSTYDGKKTRLSKILAIFREAGGKYDRIFARELQMLLLSARGEDSPIVQIAAETDIDTSKLPGIPGITVQSSLLGGSRMFYNGKLNDNSWRARLTKMLSVVTKV